MSARPSWWGRPSSTGVEVCRFLLLITMLVITRDERCAAGRAEFVLGTPDRVEQAETLAIRLANHKQAYERLQHAYRAASLQVCSNIFDPLKAFLPLKGLIGQVFGWRHRFVATRTPVHLLFNSFKEDFLVNSFTLHSQHSTLLVSRVT